jgi:hypothetical protein
MIPVGIRWLDTPRAAHVPQAATGRWPSMPRHPQLTSVPGTGRAVLSRALSNLFNSSHGPPERRVEILEPDAL